MTKSEKQRRADLSTSSLIAQALTKKLGKTFTVSASPYGAEAYDLKIDGVGCAAAFSARDLRVYMLGMARLLCVTQGIESILDIFA